MKKFAFISIFILFIFSSCATTSKNSKLYTIELSGNPTTGYHWTLAKNSDIVRLVSTDYQSKRSAKNAVGVGGKFIFNFAPVRAGEDILEFVYIRSWDAENPADKKSIKIAVEKNMTITQKDD